MWKRSVLGLIAAAPLVIAPGLALDAASSTTQPSAATSDEHCGLIAESREYACFSSFAQVDRWAQQEAGKRRAARAAGNVRVATFYEKDRMEGDSFTMFRDGTCDNDSDWDYQNPDLPDKWNDKISSFQGHGNCEVKLFENNNFNSDKAGRTFGTVSLAYIVGDAMNDQASSIRLY